MKTSPKKTNKKKSELTCKIIRKLCRERVDEAQQVEVVRLSNESVPSCLYMKLWFIGSLLALSYKKDRNPKFYGNYPPPLRLPEWRLNLCLWKVQNNLVRDTISPFKQGEHGQCTNKFERSAGKRSHFYLGNIQLLIYDVNWCEVAFIFKAFLVSVGQLNDLSERRNLVFQLCPMSKGQITDSSSDLFESRLGRVWLEFVIIFLSIKDF